METTFYSAGIFFFIFVGAMLAEISSSLSKIEKHLQSTSQEKHLK